VEQGLASELSLLIHPVIVGKDAYNIFGNINKAVSLKLRKQEALGKGYVWLVYRVTK
jgi:riboflavin biosynthesis pyrimidine reductase